ncbi:MAG TPA: ribonuclease III [Acidimicrobiia bacterium]|jgi:ribonuclease-3
MQEHDCTLLDEALGIALSDRDLLLRSLAHRSWCAEHDASPSNERLEFLGDSVLGLVVTRYVYNHFPDLPEGELSEVRAAVVNAKTLAEVARELHLGDFLLLGKGEAAAGGATKSSILADALEAVFAAVYLDAGFDATEALILRLFEERIMRATAGNGARDHKTRLQELTAALGYTRPKYVVRDEGPDHAKQFFATVVIGDDEHGEGRGRSKKEAEQAAALVALCALGEEHDG